MLANAGLLEGLNVSWLPSYGYAMRQETAHCAVVISPTPVLFPLVPMPGAVIALNRQSAERFVPVVKPGGLLVINSSMVDKYCAREDLRVMKIPATQVAEKLGDVTVASMVALGAYLERVPVVSFDSALESLKKLIGERRPKLAELSKQALREGSMIAHDQQ